MKTLLRILAFVLIPVFLVESIVRHTYRRNKVNRYVNRRRNELRG